MTVLHTEGLSRGPRRTLGSQYLDNCEDYLWMPRQSCCPAFLSAILKIVSYRWHERCFISSLGDTLYEYAQDKKTHLYIDGFPTVSDTVFEGKAFSSGKNGGKLPISCRSWERANRGRTWIKLNKNPSDVLERTREELRISPGVGNFTRLRWIDPIRKEKIPWVSMSGEH